MNFGYGTFLGGSAIALGIIIGSVIVMQKIEQTPPTGTALLYSFNNPGILFEAESPLDSSSPYFWLDSGGKLIIDNRVGTTIQGSLPTDDTWHEKYAASNPTDTDNGAHPQNIFRLVTKQSWKNASEALTFRIDADNVSASPNRNQSNGVLLMSRYQDGQTLYYAGVRIDGTAVIKKKYEGTYYTLAQTPIYPGSYAKSGNLLPHGTWLSIMSQTVTNADGSVTIALYQKKGDAWAKVLSVDDTGGSNVAKTPPIREEGRLGIRTDFMDVSFASYDIHSL